MGSPSIPGSTPQTPDPQPKDTGGGVNTFLTIALLGIIAFGAWRYFGPKSAMAGWSHDWDSAVAQSKTTGKPALVLFTADWCGPCRQLKSEVLSDATVKTTIETRFTPVIVDLSDRGGPNDRIAQDYGVQGIPTLIQFDARGKELKRTHGMSPDELVAWLSGTR
jgi:protein disulfide-isomerase